MIFECVNSVMEPNFKRKKLLNFKLVGPVNNTLDPHKKKKKKLLLENAQNVLPKRRLK